jgi:hypothetical protein
MKSSRHSYQILSLGSSAIKLCTENGLRNIYFCIYHHHIASALGFLHRMRNIKILCLFSVVHKLSDPGPRDWVCNVV